MMDNYKKLFILPFAVSALLSLGFAAFWPNKNEQTKALHFFKESNYGMALGYAAKSPLLEAYILREKPDTKIAHIKLKKALKQAKTDKEVFEIVMNLAFDAYLAGDMTQFQEQMAVLRKFEQGKDELPYLSLFKGLEAFYAGEYEKAYLYFEKESNPSAQSPWMQHAFQKEFDEAFIAEKTAFCLMQMGRLHLIDEKLRPIKKKNEARYHFLKAFYHPSSEKYLDKLKIASLQKQELTFYFDAAEKYFLRSLREQSWDSFSHWQNFFNHTSSLVDLEKIVSSLKDELTMSPVSEKIAGEIRVKLLYMMSEDVSQAFINQDFLKLEKILGFLDKESLAKKAEEHSLQLAASKKEGIEKCRASIEFWSKIEKNREKRLNFSKKLINLAKKAWIFENAPEKSKELFKIAFLIPDSQDREEILDLLETTLSRIHQKAVEETRISHYFYVLEVAKALNLNTINLYNQQEKKTLLDDAKFFLSRGHYSQAHERVQFLLTLDENHEEARILMKAIKKVYD